MCFSLILRQYPSTTITLSIVTYLRFISKENCVCMWHLDGAYGHSCAQNEVILRLWRHKSDHIHVRHAIFSALSTSIIWPGPIKILLPCIQNFRSYGLLSNPSWQHFSKRPRRAKSHEFNDVWIIYLPPSAVSLEINFNKTIILIWYEKLIKIPNQ